MFREHQAARMAQGLGYREAKKELKAAAQRALVEAQAATRQAAEAEKVRKHYTLERLLSAYCDHLETLGRRSHTDARGIFKLHVVGAFPKLAALPACDVTADNVDQMLRKLYTVDPTSKNRHDHAPRGRTANKLRAYLGAAYKVAIGHRRGDRYEFKGYNITVSPVTGTAAPQGIHRLRLHRPAFLAPWTAQASAL